MWSAMQIAIMTLDCIALMVGGLGDMAVLGLCVLEWSRKVVFCPYRVISFSVSISNLIAICLQLASDDNMFDASVLLEYVDLLSVTLLCSNLWFSTLLYIYYSIKIGVRRSTFYTWLNVKFPTILPYLLFSFLTISFVTAFIFLIEPFDNPPDNSSSALLTSIFEEHEEAYLKRQFMKSALTQSLMALTSFLISFILVTQILLSLYRHVQLVQSNNEGVGNFSLEAHFKAAKTLTVLLMFNVTFFVSMIISFASSKETLSFALSCIFISISLSIQPYILILGNTNMKKQAKEMFHCVAMDVAN